MCSNTSASVKLGKKLVDSLHRFSERAFRRDSASARSFATFIVVANCRAGQARSVEIRVDA